jgi:hypothetical protein
LNSLWKIVHNINTATIHKNQDEAKIYKKNLKEKLRMIKEKEKYGSEELHKYGEVFKRVVIEEAIQEVIPDPDSEDTASDYRTSLEESTSDSLAPSEEEIASVSAPEATTATTLNQRVISYTAREDIRMIQRKGGKAATQYEL